ncbi:MAG: helix-turn-helix domain-containing protein [Actinomycetota bacterium]|nr:helix-turn-helix domain-containing protein [Actinomycetota bacterium]
MSAQVENIAQRVLDRFCMEIPFYAGLPPAEYDRLLRMCQEHARFFLRGLPERTLPTDEELLPIFLGAARRAEENVPLDALLSSYQVGVAVMWEALRDEATAAEQSELVEAVSWLLAYVHTLSVTGAAAYLEERERIYGDERHALRSVAEALLAGDGGKDAGTKGYRLAPGYVVLAMRFGEATGGDRAAAAVSARRRVRRVEDLLDRMHGPGVLSLLQGSGGTVLLPVWARDGDTSNADLDDLVSAVVEIAGPGTSAALAWHPGLAGVAAANEEADDVLRLATALGRPPGRQRIEDVLVEYVLSCRSDAGERLLRAVIAPLSEGPDLLATLEEWFSADFDRRRSAAALHIHPNTFDYRMQRVHALTGVDPMSARGVQLLGAALVSHRLAPPL